MDRYRSKGEIKTLSKRLILSESFHKKGNRGTYTVERRKTGCIKITLQSTIVTIKGLYTVK